MNRKVCIMSDKVVIQNSGIGGALLLIAGIALIIMKMQGIITVSWWIVLIPLYPAMLGIGILAIILVLAIIVGIIWGIALLLTAPFK